MNANIVTAGLRTTADPSDTTGMLDLAGYWPKVLEVDVETTGFDPVEDRIIEIGMALVRRGVVEWDWSTLVNPGRPVPAEVSALTGITNRMLGDWLPTPAQAMQMVAAEAKGAVLSAYGAGFDRAFIENAALRADVALRAKGWGCVLKLARDTLTGTRKPASFALGEVCTGLGIVHQSAHRARGDVRALAALHTCLLRERRLNATVRDTRPDRSGSA